VKEERPPREVTEDSILNEHITGIRKQRRIRQKKNRKDQKKQCLTKNRLSSARPQRTENTHKTQEVLSKRSF
jgi:hypothetical protein